VTGGSRPVIGWYVHHHGSGHLMRMLAVQPHLDADLIVFSSFPRPDSLPGEVTWVALPRDDAHERPHADAAPVDPASTAPTAGGVLHWAPLRHRGHRGRLAMIASSLAEQNVDAMVVDVSVEVTALARLLGVPTVVVAQPGVRDDEPHRLGRRLADLVIAPWPRGAHGDQDPEMVEVGGISRFADRTRTRDPAPGTVLVLGGRGGFDLSPADLEAAQAATPHLTWSALGVAGAPWVADPWHALCGAEVVVTAAGQNSIADLAAAQARVVVVPQDRPFDEQSATARALGAAGLAVVAPRHPGSREWAGLVEAAARTTPDWRLWQVAGAALRAADAIREVAAPRSTTAVVTLFSAARLDHVLAQARAIRSDRRAPHHVGVWLDHEPPPTVPGMTVLHVPPGDHGMRLAEGRNAGAAAALSAGASLLVFLDADCVPGERMLECYVSASTEHPGALLCGPVTYLAEHQRDLDPASLALATSPHPARPAPAGDTVQSATADEYRLFWSLSFACTATTWRAIGGFDPAYQGYGAEDTDFARSAQAADVPLLWVGGADSYHQWHETTSPPWAHLDDILRNAGVFEHRWGATPMEGWLAAFAAAGAIERRDGRWRRLMG
jgi:hypothetical protein